MKLKSLHCIRIICMGFRRDIRTLTIALCVFWFWCACVGLYAQFPTASTFVGQSLFDAARLHVLDYVALAVIPTVLLKEIVWALTPQEQPFTNRRHEVQPASFQVNSSNDGPFFLLPSVKPHPAEIRSNYCRGYAKCHRFSEVYSPLANPRRYRCAGKL